MRKLLCPGFCRGTHDHPNTPIETYGYDATGNRTSLLHAGTTTPYTYPTTSHRLTNVGSVTRGYNAVGNTPSTTSIGGTAKEFVYNGNDRMSQVKLAGVVNRSYRYNAKGELVAATNGASGPVAIYILYYEAGHWLGDYDANGATKQQAVWLGESSVGVLAGAGTAQKLHYVQPDHLGTPRTVIDATRNVAIWSWNAKGEAFGNDAPNQDPDQDGTAFVFDLRFPGQRFDAATGLNYNYFRDYDAGSGRYVQSDPLGFVGGLSTYAYVENRSLTSIDPQGLSGIFFARPTPVPGPITTLPRPIPSQYRYLQPRVGETPTQYQQRISQHRIREAREWKNESPYTPRPGSTGKRAEDTGFGLIGRLLKNLKDIADDFGAIFVPICPVDGDAWPATDEEFIECIDQGLCA